MDSNKGATTIESYDPRSDKWTEAHHMSGRRLQFGIALMFDKLLVVGGKCHFSDLLLVYYTSFFDPSVLINGFVY